jgi:hypothetical protein
MSRVICTVAALIALTGCNVVPPLDCVMGVERPGCQRDANGEYGYLYRSALTPNGKYDVPAFVPPAQPVLSEGVIESRIDGDFNGWEGETVYKLQNGQIWQQADYQYHYHYAYSPVVLIYGSGGSYKMKVDGDSGTSVTVRRLK